MVTRLYDPVGGRGEDDIKEIKICAKHALDLVPMEI